MIYTYTMPYNFSSGMTTDKNEQIEILKDRLDQYDVVLVGAGAGLSTSAGFTYSGERFKKYFFDFADRFDIHDMYSGGFYPFPDEETYWAWWSRMIYFNRYIKEPLGVYADLLSLVKDKDYFVLTTNVDHQFQYAGFDKNRLYYTQGDYGLLQSAHPRVQKTYDNEDLIMRMMEAQGFVHGDDGVFKVPQDKKIKMRIPSALIPKSPDDGGKMVPNLRCDDTFVQDAGWYKAQQQYENFLLRHKHGPILYLELGVGMNTPGIIKFPFWEAVKKNKKSFYGCINYGQALCPEDIASRSICINDDIGHVFYELTGDAQTNDVHNTSLKEEGVRDAS